MLKVEMNEGLNSIEVCGNCVEICADVGLLIKVIYDCLEGKGNKEFFVDSIKQFMNDGIYAKTDIELEEINKKKGKQVKDDLLGDLKELLKELKETAKELKK